MRFLDRMEIGRRLASTLDGLRESHPLVLGLARGGVPVAYGFAGSLDAQLDVVVARAFAPTEALAGAGGAEGGLRVIAPDAVSESLHALASLDRVVAGEVAVDSREDAPSIHVAARGESDRHAALAAAVGFDANASFERRLARGALEPLGAVAQGGGFCLDTAAAAHAGVTHDDLESVIEHALAEMEDDVTRYRCGLAPADASDRVVVLVDDGLASEVTMRAVCRSIRNRNPRRLMAALPYGVPATVDALRVEVDALACLRLMPSRTAIFEGYGRGEPTMDEVASLLALDVGAPAALPA